MIKIDNQKRGCMRIYCVSAQVIGWMLFVIPATLIVTQLAGAIRFGDDKLRGILNILLHNWPLTLQIFINFMLPGMLLVIIARFIRYLIDDEYQISWLLRQSHAILYTSAIIVLAGYIGGLIKGINYMSGISAAAFTSISSNWVLSALPSIGIVLILVGTGQAIKRMILVIEESKTLAKLGTTTGVSLQKKVAELCKIGSSMSKLSGVKKYIITAIVIAGLLTSGILCYIWTRPTDQANGFYLRSYPTGKLVGPVSLTEGYIQPSFDEKNYVVADPTESELDLRSLLQNRVTAKGPRVRIEANDESKLPRVNIDARDVSLYEVLFVCASQANVQVILKDGTIILSPKEPKAPQALENISQSKTDDIDDMQKTQAAPPIKRKIVEKVVCEPNRLKLLLDKENAGCPTITLRSLDGQPFSIRGIGSPLGFITARCDPYVKATEFVLEPTVYKEKLKIPKGRFSIYLNHPDGTFVSVPFEVLPEYTINPPLLIVFNAEPNKPVVKKISVNNNYSRDFEIESVSSNKNVVGIRILGQVKFKNGYQIDLEVKPPAAEGKAMFTDLFSVNIKGGEKLPIQCNGYYSKENPK
jgi:hypothetical protein